MAWEQLFRWRGTDQEGRTLVVSVTPPSPVLPAWTVAHPEGTVVLDVQLGPEQGGVLLLSPAVARSFADALRQAADVAEPGS